MQNIMREICQHSEMEGLYIEGCSLFLKEGSESLFPSPRIATHLAGLSKLAAQIQQDGISLIESIEKCSAQVSKRNLEVEYHQEMEEFLKFCDAVDKSKSSLSRNAFKGVSITDDIVLNQGQLAEVKQNLAKNQCKLQILAMVF